MKTKKQKKRRAPRASGESKPPAAPVASERLSGYMVVWRHTMDDVPIGLFRTKEAAIAAAKKTSFRAGYAVAKKLDIDCRTPVCFNVVEFENGRPKDMLVIDRPDDV